MISVALCITHADFDKRRVESMARLRDQLRLGDITADEVTVPCFGRIPYREQTGRMPLHVWSEQQWAWGAVQKVDWVIYLQDDVIVAPAFWERFESVLRGLDDEEVDSQWVNLLTHHPGSRIAFLAGACGYETLDGLIGTGYAATRLELQNMLNWRQLEVVPGTAERISEDVLLALYCLAKVRTIFTPLPGLIDHDLSVGTLGAQEHFAHRRAFVRWDDVDRLSPTRVLDGMEGIPEFGRFYELSHTMLPGILNDAVHGAALARAYEEDRCPAEYGRYFEMIVAQKDWP